MNKKTLRVTVLLDRDLVNRRIYRELIWRPARRFNEDLRSRRSWLNALTLLYDFEHALFWPNGSRYEVPEVDSVFTDPENRWMSAFLAADDTGESPRSYSRKLDRLRLIALYCRLAGALQDEQT